MSSVGQAFLDRLLTRVVHVPHSGMMVFWTGSMTLFEVSHFDKQLPRCTSKAVFYCRMLLA
jgi:hypothetical protein